MRLIAALAFAPLLVATAASAQDLSVPADPVAAIEGDWQGIWDDWAVNIHNGTVTLTKADPDNYNWIPVGTVIGVLNNGGERVERGFHFSTSTCLNHERDSAPSRWQMIPCGGAGAGLSVYADDYELHVSGLSFRRSKSASGRQSAVTAEEPKKQGTERTERPSADDRAKAAGEAEKARIAAREQREAEFQAKMAEHEAGVAEYNRKVAEREAEIARQNAQQSAAKEAAARELEAYRLKAAAAERLQKAYDAAQRRYTSCVAGNAQACADIAAGKPVATEVADDGKASTDTDATRCISSPVVGQSSTWKDAIAATVVNGCPTAVDIRICLLRDGGWNCGVNWGLKPQESWSWSSFKSNGELFWDARVSGSNRPLGSPAGM
jgi:hypothetical protein